MESEGMIRERPGNGPDIDEEAVATKAAAGDREAFETLVIRYERRMFAFFMNRIRNADAASDLVQEAFICVLTGLKDLRDPSKFPGWLFTICRNLAAREFRARRMEPYAMDAPDEIAEITPHDWSGYFELMDLGIRSLPADLAEPVRLRFYANLTYREISKTIGIRETLVKGRLHRARQELKAKVKAFRYGMELTGSRYVRLKEKIMERTDFIRQAAFVFERLSLKDQIGMVRASLVGEKFGERLLGEIGLVRQGAEFLERYKATMSFREMMGVLNYTDRYIEARLVNTLSEEDPPLAEKIKENLFVFEDLILFDGKALVKLHAAVPEAVMLTALAGLEAKIVEHILSPFTDGEKERRMKDIVRKAPVAEDVQEARRDIIGIVKKLETGGEIHILRKNDVPDGEVHITC